MSIKVNVVLDDDVKAQMDLLVPSGRRSRVVNQALRNELLRINRERIVHDIDKLRQRTKKVKTEEIVELLRRERRQP